MHYFLNITDFSSHLFDRPIDHAIEWNHITISQLEVESDSSNAEYKMSIRVNGKLILQPTTNNIEEDYGNLIVYASSPYKESLATAYQINQHTIYNLRLIKARKRKCIEFKLKTWNLKRDQIKLSFSSNKMFDIQLLSSQGSYLKAQSKYPVLLGDPYVVHSNLRIEY